MPEVSFAYLLPVIFGEHSLIFQLLLRESNSEEYNENIKSRKRLIQEELANRLGYLDKQLMP